MLISRKWLEQYMDISDLSMEEIADKVTRAGFEVEAMYPMSQGTNLVIGEVLTCEPHPDSDHLNCTTVNVGDAVLDIVCGAPNIAAGQKVIVARVGAQLPDGEIKAGVIRGQKSNGMICSLTELGVDKHSLSEKQINGIEVLPADAPVGNSDPLKYLGLDDVILDIGLTPNRNDCQAAFNMALEIGAILDRPVQIPEFDHVADQGTATQLKVDSLTAKCPSFLGKVIGSITIKESPQWMKDLLRASGVHSINNVVDISNIVMLETGQPMHFYNKDAIHDQEITVADGFDENYTALDGITYHLQPEDIVITNQGKPIGIAGIMGGDDSKIEDDTKGLIIECAQFDHVSIRNTARRLNLNTEASIRYQKGIEPLASQKALDRAVQLLIEYADAKDIEETVVYGNNGYEPKTLTCTLDQINNRLGTDFDEEEVFDVFRRLHFEPKKVNDTFVCSIPSSRTDMEGIADLSEEIIRILGYDRLPSTLPMLEMTEGKLNPKQQMIRYVRTMMTQRGLQEAITYTLISTEKKDNAILPVGEATELALPISEERHWIRTSILPSLLDVVAYNKAHSITNVNVFELSDVENLDTYKKHLAFVLSGNLQETRWDGFSIPADFYTAKGLVEELLDHVGVAAQRIQYKENHSDVTHFHPYRSCEVWIDKEMVGYIGQIHPQYGKDTKCDDVVMAELDLDAIIDVKKSKIKFTPISKYQSVTRDVACVIERNIPVGDIVTAIQRNGRLNKENIIQNVEVFDVYQGTPMPKNLKSVAFSILFQSNKETLKDEDINELFNKILDMLEKDYGAQLRK